MSPAQLKAAREAMGLTQQQAAARAGISQAYVSLMERGERSVSGELLLKFVELYDLPPSALPLEAPRADEACNSETLAGDLAGLGYPGFAWLRLGTRRNPATVLLATLSAKDVERRVLEATPWLVAQFPEMDWEWLLREAKLREIQNRLGFVVGLARVWAARLSGEPARADTLAEVEAAFDRARLVREDTLCQESLSEAERRWLRKHRPADARYWNLLTDLTVEHLRYDP